MRIMREKMESKEKENEGYERNGRDRRRRELVQTKRERGESRLSTLTSVRVA